MDVSKTIDPNSQQLNADDLISGPRTITITKVSGADDKAQPINIGFDGDNSKPWKPCKSMRRVLVKIWGKEGAAYVGKSLTLYCDPNVKFGGIAVGGIRISHMSHIDKAETLALTVTRSQRKPFTVKPLQVQDAAPAQPATTGADAAMTAAMDAAKNGTDAFKEWWNSDEGKGMRHLVKDNMNDLQEICKITDTAIESDPFGLPPLDGDNGELVE